MNAKRRSASIHRSKPPPSTMNRPPPRSALPARTICSLLFPPTSTSVCSRSLKTFRSKLKEYLHKPGEPIEHVFFPGGGFCSVLTVLEDGRMVEVATIGREGMVGVFATAAHVIAIIGHDGPGRHGDLLPHDVRGVPQRNEPSWPVLRPAHAATRRPCSASSCSQRPATPCIRSSNGWRAGCYWQRTGSARQRLSLTQEFVAIMLGTTRPTVTVVAGTLQRAGLITYHRGHVTVLDRDKLEAGLLRVLPGRDRSSHAQSPLASPGCSHSLTSEPVLIRRRFEQRRRRCCGIELRRDSARSDVSDVRSGSTTSPQSRLLRS